jgi:hypothetical protein
MSHEQAEETIDSAVRLVRNVIGEISMPNENIIHLSMFNGMF